MRRRWLGEDRRSGTIVLEVFRQVGLGIVELWKSELVNVGEKYCWSCEFDKLALCNLVHFLLFADVSRKVQSFGWDCGLVFS